MNCEYVYGKNSLKLVKIFYINIIIHNINNDEISLRLVLTFFKQQQNN